MGILAIIERWFNRHDAAVLEALSSGPKTGEELKAAGVLSTGNCYVVLRGMERRGLIVCDEKDPEYGPHRVFRAVGMSEDSC